MTDNPSKPEELRDNTNTKSSLRYVRCEETGEFVDQHGRGFKETATGLVGTGRLYVRTATTAKPADYPAKAKPTTDPGMPPVSPSDPLDGLIKSPPLVMPQLDLQKLSAKFFSDCCKENAAQSQNPQYQPMRFLVQYDKGYACGPVVFVAAQDNQGSMYCVRVPGGAFRSVMNENGIMFKGVRAMFVLPRL